MIIYAKQKEEREFHSFEEAFFANEWHIAMTDRPRDPSQTPDFWVLGTDSDDKIVGLYKHAWVDLGDARPFYAGETPLESSHRKIIKGNIEALVLLGKNYNVHKEVDMQKLPGGYKLPREIVEEWERMCMHATLSEQLQSGSPLLDFLLTSMVVKVPVGLVHTKMFNRSVFAGGAIIETDSNSTSTEAFLASAVRTSAKGQGEIHAEEQILVDLAKEMEEAKIQRRTTGSSLHMVLIIIIAAGEEGGYMCSSCICALSKFHRDYGLDANKLQVVYATRLSDKLNTPKMLSPQSVFRELVNFHNTPKYPQLLERTRFLNSKMNSYGVGKKCNVEQTGQDVQVLVQEALSSCMDRHLCCWSHCCYYGHGPNQHAYEIGSKLNLGEMDVRQLKMLKDRINVITKEKMKGAEEAFLHS